MPMKEWVKKVQVFLTQLQSDLLVWNWDKVIIRFQFTRCLVELSTLEETSGLSEEILDECALWREKFPHLR